MDGFKLLYVLIYNDTSQTNLFLRFKNFGDKILKFIYMKLSLIYEIMLHRNSLRIRGLHFNILSPTFLNRKNKFV